MNIYNLTFSPPFKNEKTLAMRIDEIDFEMSCWMDEEKGPMATFLVSTWHSLKHIRASFQYHPTKKPSIEDVWEYVFMVSFYKLFEKENDEAIKEKTRPKIYGPTLREYGSKIQFLLDNPGTRVSAS